MSITIGSSSDLQLTIPSKGEQDWNDLMRVVFEQISAHSHTGSSGNGRQLSTASIADAAITASKILNDDIDGSKIRLDNDQWLRGRNAADNADINLIRVNSSDVVELGGSVTVSDDSISTAKIQDDAVTSAKIDDETITQTNVTNTFFRTGIYTLTSSGTRDLTDIADNSSFYEISVGGGSFGTIILKPATWARCVNTTGSSVTFNVQQGSGGTPVSVTVAANSFRDFRGSSLSSVIGTNDVGISVIS